MASRADTVNENGVVETLDGQVELDHVQTQFPEKNSDGSFEVASHELQVSPDFDGGRTANIQESNNALNNSGSNARGRVRQFLAALAANMSAMALGAILSWTATALPDMRTSEKFQFITKTEESWIGSLMTLGAAAGCPLAGTCIERIGRRKTMLVMVIPFLLGWASIIFADNVSMLYLGRFITGFCGGSYSIAAPVFITEIADVNIRGALGAGFDLMITVGILYLFVIGTFTSWRIQAMACAAIPIACGALLLLVPESPNYLVDQGKIDEASKALMWLRGSDTPEGVQPELSELRKYLEDIKAKQGTWRDVFKRSALIPISIGFALMFFQQLSGIDAITFYTVDIFKSSGTDMNENICTIIVGVVQVLATITAALLVDKYGRKSLLVVSGVFMVLSLGALGTFFYIKEHGPGGPAPANLGWLPLTSLMVYVVAFSVGFGPIPWLNIAEIMPTNVKGVAAGAVITSRWLLGFVVTKVFADLMLILGESGGYWFFGIFCLFGTIYVIFYVPETKGKSLEEVQKLFHRADSGIPATQA